MGKRSREKREKRLKGELEIKKERPETSLERFLKMVIFFGTILILFTPLILSSKFFFPFVGPKSLYFMGLTEIIFFCWLFLVIFYPKYRPRFNLISLSLLLFIVVLILATLFGVDSLYSFWSKFERMTGLLMMLHLFAFFLVIFTVFKEKDWLKIFSVSIFVGVILSFIALVSKNPSMRGGATIGNDSFLGTYLIFNLFLALYLILTTKENLKIYSSVCFLIMALELILSGARAAKLSFLGGLFLLFCLWLIFTQKGKLKILGISLFSLAAIFLIAFTFLAFQPNSFVRKRIIEKTIGETFSGRFIVWQGAWQGFLERPFLGWGPENFEYSFFKHYDPCLGTVRCGGDIWYDRAHNIIFDTLVTSGLLGFFSYLAIFGAVFWLLAKGYFHKKIDFLKSGIFSVLFVAYFVQNLTVFDMVSSYLMFFLTLAFLSFIFEKDFGQKAKLENLTPQPPYFEKTATSQKRDNFKKQLIGFLLFVLLIFCLFKFVIGPLKTDFYVIKSLQAKNSKERLLFYKKAFDSSPVGRYQIGEQFAELSLSQISQLGKTTSLEDYKKELDFLCQELEKNIKLNPLNLRTYLKLGQIYTTYSQIEPQKISQAEDILRKAFEITQKNQQIYWQLAQTKILQKNFKEAFSLAEKALELEPKRTQSYLIVIQIAKIMGDNDLANEKAKEAIKIDPSLEPKIKEILEMKY